MNRGLTKWLCVASIGLGVLLNQNCDRAQSLAKLAFASDQNEAGVSQSSIADFKIENLSVRLSEPAVDRGPKGDEIDTYASMIKTEKGFRLFSANSTPFAIDSLNNWQFNDRRSRVF